ncbi:MAG TPA: hypothetical protein DGT21_07640 [Armatimonadetes bacterium]|jgi:hypothetical protein|nr:hypothetical protein [Armatimonadota bacterium]
MPDAILSRELDYFIEAQDELLHKYHGKVLVIKQQEVIGVYDNEAEAVRQASQEHELGTFLVQRCEAGPSCYTATFCGCLVGCSV